MRLAAALGVIAVTLAAAVYVHQRHVPHFVAAHCEGGAGQGVTEWGAPASDNCAHRGGIWTLAYTLRLHPSWEDPVAVLLVIGGIAGAAAAFAASGRPAHRTNEVSVRDLGHIDRDFIERRKPWPSQGPSRIEPGTPEAIGFTGAAGIFAASRSAQRA